MCTSPVFVPNKKPTGPRYISVPCGSCPECKKKKLNQWCFRLKNEFRSTRFSVFVTLTYDDDHLKYFVGDTFMTSREIFKNKVFNDYEPCLCKKDLQNFFRRIRKAGYSIKYYAIGEYGEKTSRPHYHAIIFSDDLDFTKVDLSRFWDQGFIKLGSVSDGSIKYVCKHHLQPKNDNFFTLRSSHFAQMDSELLFLPQELSRDSRLSRHQSCLLRMVFQSAYPVIIVRGSSDKVLSCNLTFTNLLIRLKSI